MTPFPPRLWISHLWTSLHVIFSCITIWGEQKFLTYFFYSIHHFVSYYPFPSYLSNYLIKNSSIYSVSHQLLLKTTAHFFFLMWLNCMLQTGTGETEVPTAFCGSWELFLWQLFCLVFSSNNGMLNQSPCWSQVYKMSKSCSELLLLHKSRVCNYILS